MPIGFEKSTIISMSLFNGEKSSLTTEPKRPIALIEYFSTSSGFSLTSKSFMDANCVISQRYTICQYPDPTTCFTSPENLSKKTLRLEDHYFPINTHHLFSLWFTASKALPHLQILSRRIRVNYLVVLFCFRILPETSAVGNGSGIDP